MASSTLATRSASYGAAVKKANTRRSKVDMFIVHHAATPSMAGLLGIFAADGGRGTSANYAIGPFGEIVAAVPESLRAWTSGGKRDGAVVDGSVYDHRAITVEVCNAPGAGDANGWPVTAEAFDALARLIADCATRHGFPLDRDHVVNHGELLTRFKASYATACPGGMRTRMDELLALARTHQAGVQKPAATISEDDMKTAKLYRDTSNGYTFAASPSTGELWHVPDPKLLGTGGYLGLLEVLENPDPADIIELSHDSALVLAKYTFQAHDPEHRKAVVDFLSRS